jgi:hypothetical protein
VGTTVITVVLLQKCVNLRSGEIGLCATSSGVGNDVIRVQVEGISDVTEEENQGPMTSSLIRTDPGVGVMSVDCVACFIVIENCLSVCLYISLYVCPCKTVVLVLSSRDVNVIRRFSFVVDIMES